MLIDFHTHCFPDKIAPSAIAKLETVSGGLFSYTNGTLTDTQRAMKEYGIDVSVVLNIATNAHQQKSVNDFAAQINHQENIVSFGSVYPHSPDVLDELERIKALGLKGVKLHPDYQQFQVDDPKMKPIYEKISSLGLITLFHAGLDYGFPPPYKCMPKNMANALKWFSTPVIAAHWGGLNVSEEVLKHLCSLDIYFDTAFGYASMPRYYAEKILETHGTSKILFGTDLPWHTPDMELRQLDVLGLSKTEKDQICFQNAQKLLGI